LISILLCGLASFPSWASANHGDAQYGRWETYSTKTSLKYPDFELRFVGTEPGAVFPPSTQLIFQVRKKATIVEVRYVTSGDIAPALFALDDKEFVLEVEASEVLPRPAPDSRVVVWIKAEWQRRIAAQRGF
jgi:hypothetical protein